MTVDPDDYVGNTIGLAVAQFVERVNTWQAQESPAPPWVPVIYDVRIDADAARFGLAPDERDILLSRSYPGRQGSLAAVIVLHIQEGVTAGSLDWWVHGPGVRASSTVLIQRDGSILRCIPEQDAPWTNGDVDAPDAQARRLMTQHGMLDLNPITLSIEAEGRSTATMPKLEFQAIVWQVRDWMTRYAVPTDHILGHFQINSITRGQCGRYKPQVMSALGTVPPPPETFPGLTIPEAVFDKCWPTEIPPDPNGPFTQHIIAAGKYPQVLWRLMVGDDVYLQTTGGMLRWVGKTGEVEEV